MPYYSKNNGVMLDNLWDNHAMEVVTIPELAKHREIRPELPPYNCLRCIMTMVLEETISEFIKEIQ